MYSNANFQVIGHVGKVELTKTSNGKTMARINIAVNSTWKNDAGERQEKTHWIQTVCFNDALVTKVIQPYVEKGSYILVKGEVRTSKFEKDGEDRYSIDFVVDELGLLSKKD